MPKYTSCSDMMCGADDCPTCYPDNFRGGIHIDDLKDKRCRCCGEWKTNDEFANQQSHICIECKEE